MKKFFLLNILGLISLTSNGNFIANEKYFSSHRTLPTGAKVKNSDALAIVDIASQKMHISLNGKIKSYTISSASAGEGSSAGSGKTPLGWHKVKYRYGKNASIGQLFKSRQPVKGTIRTEKEWRSPNGDEVLSRIFWLEGLEPKLNNDPKGNYDSFLRHIYIHGTNQEHLLGTKASHGCIRMGNKDIINLFNDVQTAENFFVYIK